MKKAFLIMIAMVVMLFLVLTAYKNRERKHSQTRNARDLTIDQKTKIRQFWSIYRQATQDRIKGNIDAAVAGYRKALELDETHEDALYYYGNLMYELKDPVAARTAWQKLIEVNPAGSRAYFQLGDLYFNPDHPDFYDISQAEKAYRKALALNKEESAPVLRLGQIYLVKGKWSAAEKQFSAVTASNFKSVEAYFLNAYLAWKQGRDIQATHLARTAVSRLRSKQPAHGVPGEGDTKAGISFIGNKGRFVFNVRIDDLAGLNEDLLDPAFEKKFLETDAALQRWIQQ